MFNPTGQLGSVNLQSGEAGFALEPAAPTLGQQIKDGFIKFLESVKQIWLKYLPDIQQAVYKAGMFFRAPAGFALAGGLAGMTLAIIAEVVSDNKYVAIALRIAAIVSFVGMGIAIGIGISQGFLVPIV